MRKILFLLLMIPIFVFSQIQAPFGVRVGTEGAILDSIVVSGGALIHYKGVSMTNHQSYTYGWDLNGVYIDSITVTGGEWIWHLGVAIAGKVGLPFGTWIGNSDFVIDSVTVDGADITDVWIDEVEYPLGMKFFVNIDSVGDGSSDLNDGFTQATAWATINKVNSGAFDPGNQILFNKGDTWREQLIIPSEGTSGNHITFGNYGSGDLPKILGSAADSTWADNTGDVWRVGLYDDPYNIGADEAEIWFINTDGSISWANELSANIGALAAEYDWFWQNDSIYVYSTTDPGTAYTRVEIPQRNVVIVVDIMEYLTFDGLDVRYASGININGEYPQVGKMGLTIKNCTISYCGSKWLGTGWNLGLTRSDYLVQNNLIEEGGRRNFSFKVLVTENLTFSNIDIDNNIFKNGYHSTGPVFVFDGSPNNHIRGIVIRNNLIEDRASYTGDTDPSEMLAVRNDQAGGTINDVRIFNNILVSNNNKGVWHQQVDSSFIYNNTFYSFNYNIAAGVSNMTNIRIADNCTNIFIKNNIFRSFGDSDVNLFYNNIIVASTTDSSEIDVDYNLFFQLDPAIGLINLSSGGGEIYRTADWAQMKIDLPWQANEPAGSPSTKPLVFANDWYLRTGSLAIGSGLDLSAMFTTDFYGTTRSVWSVGAVEAVREGDTALVMTVDGTPATGKKDTVLVDVTIFPQQPDSLRLVADAGNDSIGKAGGTLLYTGTDTTEVQNTEYAFSPGADTIVRVELWQWYDEVQSYRSTWDTTMVDSAGASVLLTGLEASYDFEEAIDNLLDKSGNGNDGTVTNTIRQQPGKVGLYSYEFDGGDRIDIPAVISAKPFSIAVWVKTGLAAVHKTVLGSSAGDGVQYMVKSDEFMSLLKAGVTIIGTSTTQVANGDWTHVVVTYDGGGNWFHYTDGSLTGSGTNNQSFTWNTFQIGTRVSGTEDYTGYLDNLSIWSRVLDSDDVTELFNAEDAGTGYPW